MDAKKFSIPHLQSIEARAFYELEEQIILHHTQIETWFRNQFHQTPPVLTSSVDLRNAGFKISVVDTNLFPAGFNNLNPEFFPLCIQAAQSAIFEQYPRCQNILIICENHTRNTYYYQSILTLSSLIQKAGYEVKIGSLMIQNESTEISLPDGESLVLHPIERKDNKLFVNNKDKDFEPCLIILNNDLSDGIPEILLNISQPIDPMPELGWSTRSKTQHFTYYHQVCQEFSQIIKEDPWHLSPLFVDCGQVDFLHKDGLDCLTEKTTLLLTQIQAKYDEFDIKQKPYVIVKADAGTYGMAVMPIHSPDEFHQLNRKQRMNMSTRKGGQSVDHVIIQEGIPTLETIGENQSVAEPVIYMLGQHVIGGFYRVHPTKDIDENLNAPGMQFEQLAFAQCCNNPDKRLSAHHTQNIFYVYSVIARLGLLAACKEKSALDLPQRSKQ